MYPEHCLLEVCSVAVCTDQDHAEACLFLPSTDVHLPDLGIEALENLLYSHTADPVFCVT